MLGREYDPAVSQICKIAQKRFAGIQGQGQRTSEETALPIVRDLAHKSAFLRGEDEDTIDLVVKAAMDDLFRLGPIEELLADERFTEVMVNGPSDVRVEMSGKIYRTDAHFRDDAHILQIVNRLATDDDKHCDKATPICNCTLHRKGASFDGSRVNLTICPAAVDHPTIDVRKFRNDVLTPEKLMDFGTMDERCSEIMHALILARMNIVVVGGTGSGKTTTLNALSNYIPDSDRIITVEDTVELKIAKSHVVRLATRQKSAEGAGEITIHDLIIDTLRMRPDRIIVGECRGEEAFEMLQAMSTGHDGSLTTIHANDARHALSRLQMMIQMSESARNMDPAAIMKVVTDAVDIIIHVKRWPDGHRRIAEIVEVCGMQGNVPTVGNLIEYDEKTDAWKASGERLTPKHRERFASNGVAINEDWWRK